MIIKQSDIECTNFDDVTQSCYYGMYKPCEEDYFHRSGGMPYPCFCTMIDSETIGDNTTGKTPNVWIDIKYVAVCCKHYTDKPRAID
jgi:hypothetical protein